jgi:hypothetical protein
MLIEPAASNYFRNYMATNVEKCKRNKGKKNYANRRTGAIIYKEDTTYAYSKPNIVDSF